MFYSQIIPDSPPPTPPSEFSSDPQNLEDIDDSSSDYSIETPEKVLIKQGAEALLYRTTFLLPTLPALLKHRPSKPYRHPALDARLTKHRCLSEARLLVRIRSMGLAEVAQAIAEKEEANGGSVENDSTPSSCGYGNKRRQRPKPKVQVPSVYFVDESRGEIFMEWIEGKTVREVLDLLLLHHYHRYLPTNDEEEVEGGERRLELDLPLEKNLKSLMRNIGSVISHLHNSLDIIHGDLTTSNIMLRQQEQQEQKAQSENTMFDIEQGKYEVVLVDFGLGAVSNSEEDKAVDLYVLERAFISTHPRAEKLFGELLSAYAEEGGKKAESVLKRLVDVRMRGRKKSMIG